MIFSNIWDLLEDMRASGSTNILCADGVDGVVGFGWVCQDTEKVWAISMANTSRTGNLQGRENSVLLQQYLSTAENRRKIVELLDTAPYLQQKRSRVLFPKFEYSDLIHKQTVVPGHFFMGKEDKTCSNLVVCDACGLEGWLVWEGSTDDRKPVIKSYHPLQLCTKENE